MVNSYTAPSSNQRLAALAPASLSIATSNTATSNKWRYWPVQAREKKTGSSVVATSARPTARAVSPSRQHSRARSPQRSLSPPRQLDRLAWRPATAAAAAAVPVAAVAVPEQVQAAPVRKTLGQLVAELDVAELDDREVSHWALPQRTRPLTPRRGINNRAAQLSSGIMSPPKFERLQMAPLQVPQVPVLVPVQEVPVPTGTAALGTASIGSITVADNR
jgi:hypothetical protein